MGGSDGIGSRSPVRTCGNVPVNFVFFARCKTGAEHINQVLKRVFCGVCRRCKVAEPGAVWACVAIVCGCGHQAARGDAQAAGWVCERARVCRGGVRQSVTAGVRFAAFRRDLDLQRFCLSYFGTEFDKQPLVRVLPDFDPTEFLHLFNAADGHACRQSSRAHRAF